MFLALALCLLQAPASHAGLHPAGAELFLESPDVHALLAAYGEAPMAQMFADEEALGALRKLLGRPALAGRDLLDAGLGLLPVPPEVSGGARASLEQLGAASFSLVGPSATGGPGALCVLDWRSEEAAAKAEGALAAFAKESPDRWVERKGARVAAGGGSLTAAAWAALRDGSAPSLGKDAAWNADAARLGPASGAPVARGFHRRSPLLLARDLVPALSEAPVERLSEVLFGSGAMHWRMSLAHGRFVSESFAPGATRPLASAPWLAPAPFAPALLEEVHPGSLIVAGASLDPAGLREALAKSLGVDLSSAALFDKLGRNAVLFVQPVRGMGLPRSMAVIELAQSEGAIADVAALAQALALGLPGTEVKTSTYKDVPFVTINLPPGALSLGDLGELTPVIAVLDGKLIVTSGSLNLKKEIRRRQGDEKEALGPAAYPWTGGKAAVPKEATAVLYIDWAAQVEALFGLARAFGPMLQQFDVPFDLSQLPSPLVFTRHMPPTLHVVRQVPKGLAVRHEAGFAFETWLGLAGLGALVRQQLADAGPAALAQVTPAGADPAAETRHTVMELRTALSVYKLDRGAFPDALAALLEPSPSYPSGYLDGRTALPLDAWGRAYRYVRAPDGATCRVWSTGPDGVDEDGNGDDVRDL